MGAEERPDEEPSQALVTGRPTTVVYAGDWPPEQAPRGLFKRYEVRGRVCEVVPHILFLRKDDDSAEFIHGHYKRAHATRDRQRAQVCRGGGGGPRRAPRRRVVSWCVKPV